MNAGSRAAAALLAVLALGKCAAASGGGGAVPSTPSGSAGLRGIAVDAVRCSPQQWQPDRSQAHGLPGMPVRVIICPLSMPTAGGPPTDLRPAPPALIQALSLPDAPKPTGQFACAAYADVPRLVYAELADGSLYLIHIPVDACSHYLPAAATVVNRYAHDGPALG
jgi:hypothetical protein